MAENSKIEWTDHTFNPWIGCTKVSSACKHCYAETLMDHRYGNVEWGENGTRVITRDANWKKPIRWNREAEEKGIRYRVFCASLADVFEDWAGPILSSTGNRLYFQADKSWKNVIPESMSSRSCDAVSMYHVRKRLFEMIDSTPNLDWLLLTKRPENIRKFWVDEKVPWRATGLWHRDNVWLGTSTENQEQANKRIPELLKCRDLSPVLFVSAEPLLGQISFGGIPFKTRDQSEVRSGGVTSNDWTTLYGNALDGFRATSMFSGTNDNPKLDWVIAGGESGPGARPSHPNWYRSIQMQCKSASVPFLFKQWGEWLPVSQGGSNGAMHEWEDGEVSINVGKKYAGRLLDGQLHDGFPLQADAPT